MSLHKIQPLINWTDAEKQICCWFALTLTHEIKMCLAEQLVEKGIVAKTKPQTVSAPEGLCREEGGAVEDLKLALRLGYEELKTKPCKI